MYINQHIHKLNVIELAKRLNSISIVFNTNLGMSLVKVVQELPSCL